MADVALPTIATFHIIRKHLRNSHVLACCTISMNRSQNMHGINCACPDLVQRFENRLSSVNAGARRVHKVSS